jgi:hypothetical protein
MENIKLDYFIGKNCQIVSKIDNINSKFNEVYYDFGIIKEVNYQEGFILINTPNGFINKKIENIYDILPIDNSL